MISLPTDSRQLNCQVQKAIGEGGEGCAEDFFVAVMLENKNAAVALIFAAVPRCCGGKKMLPGGLEICSGKVGF